MLLIEMPCRHAAMRRVAKIRHVEEWSIVSWLIQRCYYAIVAAITMALLFRHFSLPLHPITLTLRDTP